MKKYVSIVLIIAMSINNLGMSIFASSVQRVVINAQYETMKKNEDITYRYYKSISQQYLLNDDKDIIKEENSNVESSEELKKSNDKNEITEEKSIVENVDVLENKEEIESEGEQAIIAEECRDETIIISTNSYIDENSVDETDDNADCDSKSDILFVSATKNEFKNSFATVSDSEKSLDLNSNISDNISSQSVTKIRLASSSVVATCNILFEEKVIKQEGGLFGADAEISGRVLMCDSSDFNKIYNKIQASYSSIKYVEFIEYEFLEASDSNVEILDFVEGETLYTKWDKVDEDTLKIRTGGFTLNPFNYYSKFKIKNSMGLFKNWRSIHKIQYTADFACDQEDGSNYDEMFQNCDKLEEIELKKICPYYTMATSSNSMFEGCENISFIDLDYDGFAKIRCATNMFKDCKKLETISVKMNNTNSFGSLLVSDDMFLGCEKLEGNGGSKYNPNNVSGKFARIDYGGIQPGYLSAEHVVNPCVFHIKKDWANNLSVSKEEVLGIKVLKNNLGVGTYSEMFCLNDEEDTYGYYDDEHNVLKLHMSDEAGLFADEDLSFAFADFANCEFVSGLEYIKMDDVKNISGLFKNNKELISLDVSSFNTSNVTTMSEVFYGCSKLDTLYLSNWDTGKVLDMRSMFEGMKELNNINVENGFGRSAKYMSYMFAGCSSLETLNLSNIDTSNVKDMSYMFANCSTISTIDLSDFDVSSVENMSHMFSNMKNIANLNVNNFNLQNATNISYMFAGCSKLTNIDFHSWNTRNIENFSGLFASCSELRELDLSFFDTLKARDMSYMFSDCVNIETLNTMSFKTKNVIDMSYMFNNIDKIETINIYNFNTKNVDNMSCMFANCNILKTIYVAYDFNTDKLIYPSQHRDIFINSRELVGGYGTSFVNKYNENPVSAVDKTYAIIDGDIRFGRPQGYLTFYYPSMKVRLKANGGKFLDGGEEVIYDIENGDSTSWFEEPTRKGYAFEDYYVGNELLHDTWDYVITCDMDNLIIDVDAKWSANNYRVAYNSNGGRGSMPVDIATYGEWYTIKENAFTRDGYDFESWTNNSYSYQSNTQVKNLATENNAVAILTAKWRPKTFDIIYHGNGASSGGMSNVYGRSFGVDYRIEPNNFEKAGWTFNGWSISTDSSVAYGDMATISAVEGYRPVIDLYASWILTSSIKGKLVLDGNGGLVNWVPVFTRYYSRGDRILEPSLYYVGHEFIGWTKNGNLTNYPDECDFEKLTIVASWGNIRYRVRYHKNDGSGEVIVDDDLEYDLSYNIKKNNDASIDFDRKYYDFSGWSYESGGVKVFDGGEEVTNLIGAERGIVDLYALWSGKEYNITLHDYYNYDTYREDRTDTYRYGENKNIASMVGNNGIATIAGARCVFSLWKGTASDAKLVRYYNSHIADIIYEVSLRPHIHLYPVWIPANGSRYLTFDANGGLINGVNKVAVPVTTDSVIPYPERTGRTIARRGYRLNGWCDEDRITAFSAVTVSFSGNKTIYANWDDSGLTYTIEYIDSDSDVIPQRVIIPNVPCNTTFKLHRNEFERLGYTFVGWDTSESKNTVIYKDRATVSNLGDAGDIIKLYAVWEANKYNVNYYDHNNGDMLFATDSLIYDRPLKLKSNINIQRGYVDNGFEYIKPGGEKKIFASGQMVTKDDLIIENTTDEINLFGLVEKKEYRMTFDANGGQYEDGSNIIIATAYNGDNILSKYPASPSKAGMNFEGYTIDGIVTRPEIYDYIEDKVFLATYSDVLFKIVFNKNAPVSPGNYINKVIGFMATRSENIDTEIELNGCDYSLMGYTFIGFATSSYTAKEAEHMRDNHSDLIIASYSKITFSHEDGGYENGIVNLYALWTRNKVRVTVVQNEEYTFHTPIKDPYATESYIYYDQVLSESPVFTPGKVRNGYTFTGKFITTQIKEPICRKKYNGSNCNYATFSSVNRVTGELLLYPLWLNEEYNVEMNLGEGNLPPGYSRASFTAYYDAPYFSKGKEGEPKLEENGHFVTPIATLNEIYMFDNWCEDLTGFSTISETTIYNDVSIATVYATYRKRSKYIYKYLPNGGSGSMPVENDVLEGIPRNLIPNRFSKSGYSFAGWKDQYNNLYGNQHPINYPNRSLTFTAQWNQNTAVSNPGGPGGGGGGGGGSRGGGGGKGPGGVGGGSIPIQQIDNVLHTILYKTEYEWAYDENNKRNGVKLKKDTKLAKLLMGNTEYSDRYLTDPSIDYILLKNGFYNLEFQTGNFYFGLDNNGKMMTGFVITTENTTNQEANYENWKLVNTGVKDSAKYYLMEYIEDYRGAVWALPVSLDGVDYAFDSQGRVISETPVHTSGNEDDVIKNGEWEYNIDNNFWSYDIVKTDGSKEKLKNGLYDIEYLGEVHKYKFDENGMMLTGLLEHQGYYYYFQEEGTFFGGSYIGEMIYNGVKMIFDIDGKLISVKQD